MEILARARRLDLLSRPSIEAVFNNHGIDTGEFDVLATLQRSGRPYTLRPTELYETLMISSGGLTDRLARLEKRGLIARTPSPSDGRSLLVKLTAKGRALIDKAFEEDMKIELELLAPLDRKERDTLASLLAKLLIGIEENRTPESHSNRR
ncbi:MAG: MarR family winged helix-turn-helix transcriptional regulator [Parvularculaceae bacterium]